MMSWVTPEARNPQLAMLATPGEIFGKNAAKARNAIMHTLAAAGAKAGHHAQSGAQSAAQRDRTDADHERHPPGVQHAGEDVAAKRVAAEQMRSIRSSQTLRGRLLEGID